MKDTDLYSRILGLSAPWFVADVKLDTTALESRKTIWIFDSDANIYSASTFVGSALMGVYALPVLYTTSAFFACVQNRFSESRSDLFPSLLSWQPWVSFDVVSAWRAACERLTHKEVALQAA